MASKTNPAVDTVASRNGEDQLQRRWRVAGARAGMLIVHGMGEHSQRYEHVGQFFASHDFDVLAFDNQGFGESGGRRGHIDSFNTFLDDIEDLVADRRDLGHPVILMGHSLGGLMATIYLRSNRPKPDFAVLSAPALGANVPRWQRVAAPLMGRLAPSVFIPAKPVPGLLSRDESVDAAYAEDPLVVRGATAGLGRAVFAAMGEASASTADFGLPTYVFHGDADELVPQSFSRPLEALPSVTYRSWPGLRHEALNEPEQDQVMAETLHWLNDQLALGG